MKALTFIVTKEEGVYTAHALDAGIVTESTTLDGLIAHIEEAIVLYQESSHIPSPYTIVFSGVTA